MQAISVLVVDDHLLFRNGLVGVLKSFDLMFKIMEASNGEEALKICHAERVGLMFLDLNMPVLNGFKVIRHLKSYRVVIKTIVLSAYEDETLIFNLLRLGVNGYLNKGTAPAEILQAIQALLDGDSFFPDKYNSAIRKRLGDKNLSIIDLSDNEIRIIELLSLGLTSKEIALRMDYTVRTVETKKIRLEKKLHVKNSSEIVSICFRMGIID